jgi:hypothetical protein
MYGINHPKEVKGLALKFYCGERSNHFFASI